MHVFGHGMYAYGGVCREVRATITLHRIRVRKTGLSCRYAYIYLFASASEAVII